MKILTIKEAVKLYPSVYGYCQHMGVCGNCIHIKRTSKYTRPVQYYCFLHTCREALDTRTNWNDKERKWEVEDREWEDDDIFYVKKTRIPCKEFEANTWWKNQVEKLLNIYSA
jgi:hypothetical protein